MTSITFNDIQHAFKTFSQIALKNNIDKSSFSRNLTMFKHGYCGNRGKILFCEEADALAEKLIKQGNYDFSGIIYSCITKICKNNPELLEKYAIKGYSIACQNGDYIHMLSRLDDLRKLYDRNPEKLYDFIQVMYAQEKCLENLSYNYEATTSTYKTILRKAAPKEDYEKMLGYIQTDIAKLIRNKHPDNSFKRLDSARRIFTKYNNIQGVDYIDRLKSKIESGIILNKFV